MHSSCLCDAEEYWRCPVHASMDACVPILPVRRCANETCGRRLAESNHNSLCFACQRRQREEAFRLEQRRALSDLCPKCGDDRHAGSCEHPLRPWVDAGRKALARPARPTVLRCRCGKPQFHTGACPNPRPERRKIAEPVRAQIAAADRTLSAREVARRFGVSWPTVAQIRREQPEGAEVSR